MTNLSGTNITAVTVTGKFVDFTGAAIHGTVTFTPTPAAMTDAAAKYTFMPQPVTVPITSGGAIVVELAATDDPDGNPVGFTYTVTENFTGGRTYPISLPAAGTPYDLADISPASSESGGAATWAGVPTGGSVGQAVGKASAADYDTEWVPVAGPCSVGATPLTNVDFATVTGTTPVVFANFGGYLWGAYGSAISRSSDEGATWSAYCVGPESSIIDARATFDGEVVMITGSKLWRSSGWAGGSPSWSLKATANGTCQFQGWSLNGDGTKFITTEYSSTRADSRYGRISLDGGVTWATKYDSVTMHGATLADSSHLHGCEYDPWTDRFYLSEGHDDGGSVGDIAGIYCSDDDGDTWTRAEGMKQNPAPTVLVATDDGLVCASDSASPGLWGVQRRTDSADEELRWTWRWNVGIDGVIGFGTQGRRDPSTGLVYVGFRAGVPTAVPVIAAGSASTASLVYTDSASTVTLADSVYGVWIPTEGRLVAGSFVNAARSRITAAIGAPSVSSTSAADAGGVLGGTAKGSSVAVGKGATGGSAIRSTAVGIGASTSASIQDSVAVGWGATVAATSGTAVGSGATSSGSAGVAIGQGATTGAHSENTVVGAGASGTSSAATAIGRNATAGNAAVAVGSGAVAAAVGTSIGYQATTGTATYGVALGCQASTAAGNYGVALGASVSTTAANQVAVGPRHFEIAEVTAPSAPGANLARLYVEDNGSGKTRLVVRFPTGAAQVLSTEP